MRDRQPAGVVLEVARQIENVREAAALLQAIAAHWAKQSGGAVWVKLELSSNYESPSFAVYFEPAVAMFEADDLTVLGGMVEAHFRSGNAHA